MIDIENELFTLIATELRTKFNPIFIAGESVHAPATFPAVTIEEADNYVYERSQTGNQGENHANLMYEINVYSNKQDGRKRECKEIFGVIDTMMISIGFTRTMLNPIPNLEDATIYRMVGRYKTIVSADKTLIRR